MPFQKGQSGNPAGRKSGSANAVNRDLRASISKLLEDTFPQVVADLASLEPKDRVVLWLKLAEFSMPRMRYLEHDICRADGQCVEIEEVR